MSSSDRGEKAAGQSVTVEGSVTPSDWLGRGVRRTVAVTNEIRNLLRIGAVVLIAGSLDVPDVDDDSFRAQNQ